MPCLRSKAGRKVHMLISTLSKKPPFTADEIYPTRYWQPEENPMLTRTRRKTITFCRPFSLEGIGRQFPAGSDEVVTDEELIEGLSFPVYRRVATTMLAPAQSYQGSVEMLTIDPDELAAAIERDASTNSADAISAKAQ